MKLGQLVGILEGGGDRDMHTRIHKENDALISFLFSLRRGRKTKKLNSVLLVRKPMIPKERPPLVGEVSANFCG
jgi:hypothetical protein